MYKQSEQSDFDGPHEWIVGGPDSEGLWRLAADGDVRYSRVVEVESGIDGGWIYTMLGTDEVFALRKPFGKWQKLTNEEASRYE